MSAPGGGSRGGGSRDVPPEVLGGTTGARGTPVAVRVSGDERAHSAIALFLAGPVIWSVHFMVVYLVAEAGCTGDGPGLEVFDPPVPGAVTVLATVVAAVACLVCAWLAYRRWRTEAADGGRTTLAIGGMLLSLLGFVTVLMVGVPALVLGSC